MAAPLWTNGELMLDKYLTSLGNVMNYQKHYNLLIQRAKHRLLEGYVEVHHVIPKCVGGNDDKNNLVSLTAEEHFVAHLLLTKIYPNNTKLIFAANMMCTNANNQQRNNNKRYSWLRKKVALAISAMNSGRLRGPRSDETKAKISAGNKGKIMPPKTLEQRMKSSRPGPKNSMWGRTHSDETKIKIGIKSVGRKTRLGAILSNETKEKCRIAALRRQRYECIHCSKMVTKSNLTRWHNNNCKNKDQ